MTSYMLKSCAENAVLIGSTLLSNNAFKGAWPSQCQFACTPSAPFDSQGSLIGAPRLAKIVFQIFQGLAESAQLIGSMVLSIN
jgi:hypothetical protein